MWFNGIITWVLRSPLHIFASNTMILIRYQGRKSGKTYIIPVNYFTINDQESEVLISTSFRQRKWWRNLGGGAPVSIYLQGRTLSAIAEVIEDDEGVASNLEKLFSKSPKIAHYMGVHLSPDGQPIDLEVKKAASSRVIILTHREL